MNRWLFTQYLQEYCKFVFIYYLGRPFVRMLVCLYEVMLEVQFNSISWWCHTLQNRGNFIVMFCTVKSIDKCKETADILIMFVILFQAFVYCFSVWYSQRCWTQPTNKKCQNHGTCRGSSTKRFKMHHKHENVARISFALLQHTHR
jgi:hypothetical protein